MDTTRDTTPTPNVERLADMIHAMGAEILYCPWQVAEPEDRQEIVLTEAGSMLVVSVKAGDRRQEFEIHNLPSDKLEEVVRILANQTGFSFRYNP